MDLGLFELRSKVTEQMAAGAGPLEVMMAMSRPFRPNPLNSVVFLVEVAQRATALVVNYRGRPWMNALGENGPLLIGTTGALALVALCAVGWSPLMRPLQLAALTW